MWPDRRILDLFNIEVPIILAPMAGAMDSKLVIEVCAAGGLGSLPCALLDAAQMRAEVETIRRATARPVNLNFFCHPPPEIDADRERAWKERLERYYVELGLDPGAPLKSANRRAFDAEMCELIEQLRPEVVSFHFGLPEPALLARVHAARARVIASATTVEEALWLEVRGCHAIIAQGFEAGGHRGMFLSGDIATQVGTLALVPQVVDAVKVPVIAAGGIADSRGIAAAFALGASAVQLGTAYLFCPEAKVNAVYLAGLRHARDNHTALTNIFSGRPARGIVNRAVREVGPMSDLAPDFPLAAGAMAPLRSKSEKSGSPDFAQMWSGQAAHLGREIPAGDLTRRLAEETLARFAALAR